MKVLIVAKTRRGKTACVGGIAIPSGEYVRLRREGGWDQPINTPLEVGDIWDIEYYKLDGLEPPHVEDVIVVSQKFIEKVDDIEGLIRKLGVRIYKGSPRNIFDGRLKWSITGSGYIDKDSIPSNSVGFWVPDRSLKLYHENDRPYYKYESPIQFCRFPYVGLSEPINIIPAGKLVRVSLARWWKSEQADVEERCYLQISGWY